MSEDQNQATPTTESSPLAAFFESFAKFQAEQEETWDYNPTYPLHVSGVEVGHPGGINPAYRKEVGALVKVRPVGEEYEGKTYLGIYLGDLTIEAVAVRNKKDDTLHIRYIRNPALYVFSLKRIIYGRESWWSTINPAGTDNISLITDDDLKVQGEAFEAMLKIAKRLQDQQKTEEESVNGLPEAHSS